jgi:site-specific recombinase XerC
MPVQATTATRAADIHRTPTVDEIIAVMRAAGDAPEGVRLCAVIVVLWRAGLRISEALSLNETDLDPDRGAVLVRRGKGQKRREFGMDRWAWAHYSDLAVMPTCIGDSLLAQEARPARSE